MRSLPLLFLPFAKSDRNSPTPTEKAIAICLVFEGDRSFGLTKACAYRDRATLQADDSTPALAVALSLLAH